MSNTDAGKVTRLPTARDEPVKNPVTGLPKDGEFVIMGGRRHNSDKAPDVLESSRRILEYAAKRNLSRVVVLGWDENDYYYTDNNMERSGDILELFEVFKSKLHKKFSE